MGLDHKRNIYHRFTESSQLCVWSDAVVGAECPEAEVGVMVTGVVEEVEIGWCMV